MTNFVFTYDIVVGISFSIFASISNIIALAVLSKCKEMVPQIKMFATNLAISDFLMGMFWVVSLLFIGPLVGELTTTIYYRIYCHILSCIGMVSVISVCCLALDRFLTCLIPMKYPFWITSCKAAICNVVVWLLANLLSFITFNQASKNQMNGFQTWLRDRFALSVDCLSYTIFFLFMATAYGYIMRHAKRTANHVVPRHLNAKGNLTSFLHFFRSSFVTLIVSMLVIVSHLCIFCILITALTCELTDNQISNMHKAICGFCITTAMLNPVLYIWRFKECQIHFLKMFCNWNPKIRPLTVAMISDLASRTSPKQIPDSECSVSTDGSFSFGDKDECRSTPKCVWTPDSVTGNFTDFDFTCTTKPKGCNFPPESPKFSEGNNKDRAGSRPVKTY